MPDSLFLVEKRTCCCAMMTIVSAPGGESDHFFRWLREEVLSKLQQQGTMKNLVVWIAGTAVLLQVTESLTIKPIKVPPKPPPSLILSKFVSSSLDETTQHRNSSSKSLVRLPTNNPVACQASRAMEVPAPLVPFTARIKHKLVQYYNGYMNALDTKPFRTTCVSAAVINAVGCILSQYIRAAVTQSTLTIQWVQMGAFFLTGLVFKGPYYHAWYNLLARVSQRFYPTNPGHQVAWKVGVDQTLGVILFFPTYFYVYELLFSCVSLRWPALAAAHATCLANLAGVIKANFCVWPAFQYLNFKYIPATLRVVATSLMAVLWNCYFCSRVV